MKIHDITPLVIGNTARMMNIIIIRPFLMYVVPSPRGLISPLPHQDAILNPEYSYHWLSYSRKPQATLPVGPPSLYQTPGDYMSLPTIRVGPYLIYQATATRVEDGDLGVAILPGGHGYLWTMVPRGHPAPACQSPDTHLRDGDTEVTG